MIGDREIESGGSCSSACHVRPTATTRMAPPWERMRLRQPASSLAAFRLVLNLRHWFRAGGFGSGDDRIIVQSVAATGLVGEIVKKKYSSFCN